MTDNEKLVALLIIAASAYIVFTSQPMNMVAQSSGNVAGNAPWYLTYNAPPIGDASYMPVAYQASAGINVPQQPSCGTCANFGIGYSSQY